MAFNDLSQSVQDIYMVGFEMFGKFFLLAIVFITSALYLFYFRKHQKPTPYYLMGNVRGIFTMLSFIVITMFPLTIFYLYPQVSIEILLQFLVWFYVVGFALGFIVFTVNTMYFGTTFISSLMGYEPSNRHKRVYKDVIETTHGKRWKDQ